MAICGAAAIRPPVRQAAQTNFLIAFSPCCFLDDLPVATSAGSIPFFDLFLAEALPDHRAKMDKAFEVHHVLDPRQAVPVLGLTEGLYVNDLLDAPRPARHDRYAIGEIDGLLHTMRDEQDSAGIDPRQAHELLLHENARLCVERPERFIHE